MYCHIFKKFQTPCILSCEKERLTKKINFGGFLLCFFLSFSDVFCFLPLQIFPPQPRYYLVNSLLLRGGLSPPPIHTKTSYRASSSRAVIAFYKLPNVFFLHLVIFFLFFFRMFTGSAIDCKAAPYSTLFLRALYIFVKLFKNIITMLLYVPQLSIFFIGND